MNYRLDTAGRCQLQNGCYRAMPFSGTFCCQFPSKDFLSLKKKMLFLFGQTDSPAVIRPLYSSSLQEAVVCWLPITGEKSWSDRSSVAKYLFFFYQQNIFSFRATLFLEFKRQGRHSFLPNRFHGFKVPLCLGRASFVFHSINLPVGEAATIQTVHPT